MIRKHKCPECEKEFTRKDNMQAHLRKVHRQEPLISKNSKIKCSDCQETFENMEIFRSHISSNHAIDIETEELDFPTFDGKQTHLLKAV